MRSARGRLDGSGESRARSARPTSPEAAEPIAAFVLSNEFRAKFTDADKYLAVLAWIAERHKAEFGEFILSQSGSRRYLSMSREEILVVT